jgi:N-acetylglucosaminyl-diphospho-decaprenol L-rhamnosyltransferase
LRPELAKLCDSSVHMTTNVTGAEFSVIIVTFNSALVIGEALESVATFLPASEVITVDNGSSDETCAIIRRHPGVKLIVGHPNIGFGAAVNLGAQAAGRRYLVCINPDSRIVASDPPQLGHIAATRRPILYACELQDGRTARYAVHGVWGWRRELGLVMAQWFLVPQQMTLRRASARRNRRRWVSGVAFIVPDDAFHTIGGFDAAFKLYFEDMDFSIRWQGVGFDIKTTAALAVTHVGQDSADGNRPRSHAWALLSLIELAAKSGGQEEADRAARWVLNALAGVESLGNILARVPRVGGRSQKKGREAGELHQRLLTEASDVDGTQYGEARLALRGVLARS